MKYCCNTTMMCWPLHHSYKQIAGLIVPRIWGYLEFTGCILLMPFYLQKIYWYNHNINLSFKCTASPLVMCPLHLTAVESFSEGFISTSAAGILPNGGEK